MSPCSTCGAPTKERICGNCALCGDLLAEEPIQRLSALQAAPATDRAKVMAAALRGGHLYEDVSVQGEDLGVALLGWLLKNAPTLTWIRYIAEDARWGWTTQAVLAVQEPERSLLRLPEWVSQSRGKPEAVVRAYVGTSPERIAALSLRLGSCDVPASRWRGGLPAGSGPAVSVASFAARRTPTAGWRPARLDRQPRRWPFPRREQGLPLCCTRCGEALPGFGPCYWCATSPDDEPPTLAPLNDLFKPRKTCGTCGFDQATGLAPASCGGCGAQV